VLFKVQAQLQRRGRLGDEGSSMTFSSLMPVISCELGMHDVGHCLAAVDHVQLFQDLAQVGLDHVLGNGQAACNLLVTGTLGN